MSFKFVRYFLDHKLKNLQMKSSYYEVKGFLDALEMSLHGKTKYIFGENPTLADFISYVIISRIYLISQNRHLLGARTLKYWDRLLKIQDLNKLKKRFLHLFSASEICKEYNNSFLSTINSYFEIELGIDYVNIMILFILTLALGFITIGIGFTLNIFLFIYFCLNWPFTPNEYKFV